MKKMQELIVKISTRFINLSGTEIDYWIDSTLQEIGEFCGVDRSYVFMLSAGNEQMSNTHEWCREGITPQMNELKNEQLADWPWWKKQLHRKAPIVIFDINELPAAASSEKKNWQAHEIKSLVTVPMIYNKVNIGFLGFDAVTALHKWNDSEIMLLKMIADILASAMERKKTEDSLSSAESLYQLFINTINEGIAISQNDRFIFVNQKLADMLGYTAAEMTGKDYHEIYTTKGQELLAERQRMRRVGKVPPQRYETTFKRKNGRTIDVSVSPVITEYKGALATFGVISDITEYKRLSLAQQALEVKLLKQQRMQSLTLMMSGIIHNIKNTLTIVMGRAQLLKIRLPQLKEPDLIINSVKKIESLLTSFIDKIYFEQENKRVQINLSDLLKNELLFLETEAFFKAEIKKELVLQRDLPPITGYYSDFSQGLMNIVNCCVESMRDTPQKILTVKTSALPKGVQVEILTTGKHIAEEHIEALVAPKYFRLDPEQAEQSDQSALIKFNLYNAYMLLNGYGAKFTVINKPEGGTILRVLFPVENDR